MGEFLRQGRPISDEYLPVIDWLSTKAKPNGVFYHWGRFKDKKEASASMRRLGACLRSQVKLPAGQRLSIRRSIPKEEPRSIDVVVFVIQEPVGTTRMPQGQR